MLYNALWFVPPLLGDGVSFLEQEIKNPYTIKYKTYTKHWLNTKFIINVAFVPELEERSMRFFYEIVNTKRVQNAAKQTYKIILIAVPFANI